MKLTLMDKLEVMSCEELIELLDITEEDILNEFGAYIITHKQEIEKRLDSYLEYDELSDMEWPTEEDDWNG